MFTLPEGGTEALGHGGVRLSMADILSEVIGVLLEFMLLTWCGPQGASRRLDPKTVPLS